MTSHVSSTCGSAGKREEAAGPADSSGLAGLTGSDRCILLSSGQLEVLRLVNRHLNSKEIGAKLSISSHTVDQRVRCAMQRLGVSRRSEAARLVDDFERRQEAITPRLPADEPYQRLIHQSPDSDSKPEQGHTDPAVSSQIRHADRTGGDGADGLETEQRSHGSAPLLFPVSTPQQPSNGWSVGRRVVAIAGVAIAASFSAGMFLAGLESLARLIRP
jgi:DNA-binding CsgD family transcriptional regulator